MGRKSMPGGKDSKNVELEIQKARARMAKL